MKHLKKLALSILVLSMLTSALLVQAMAIDVVSKPAPSDGSYSDVSGTWFEKWVGSYGYSEIFSNGDGLFHPDKAITRMEFARLLHESLRININYFAPVDIAEFYGDVKNSDKGASELYDLASLGIIDTKTSFRPADTLSRDEMIHFIMNAFEHFKGDDIMYTQIYRVFADDKDIRQEYSADIQHSSSLGLITGRSDNYLKPRDAATRAEAVTVTGKLAELLKKDESKVSVTAAAAVKDGALVLSISIKNNSDKAVTINHSSQQSFDFKAFDKDGNSLYCWSASRMFAQMVSTTTIEPNKEIVFSDTVDKASYSAFSAQLKTVVGYITGTSDDFKINTNGYTVQLAA